VDVVKVNIKQEVTTGNKNDVPEYCNGAAMPKKPPSGREVAEHSEAIARSEGENVSIYISPPVKNQIDF